jgi:phosphoglycerate kinase
MLIDATIVEYAKEIMQLAIEKNITLVIPKDIIIKRLLLPDQVALATSGDYMKMDVEAGVTYIVQDVSAYRYHEHDCVVDIGPKTIALYISHIAKGKTIFANGTMGIYENQESSHGTAAILSAIASNNNMTILGGGDCVAAAEQFQVGGSISFLSTGGGATLAYLAAGNPYEELPGLHALII